MFNIFKKKNSMSEDDYFSVDNFLYVRCAVVANGKEFYYKVLNNPENMLKDLEFESLLDIAPQSYKKRNNEELDYTPKYDYETYSNSNKWSKI